MEKRLIPYSVHLPEDIFLKIKAAAEGRKAAGIVRQAIIAFLDDSEPYKNGYNAGIADAVKKIGNNKTAKSIAFEGNSISDILAKELNALTY